MKKPSPETLRRLRRAGIGTGFGLFVFIVALYVWFPYDRAKEVAINIAAAQNLDVEIESAGPAWGLGLAFTNIRVKTRPTSPTAKPSHFTIERATVTTSLLSVVFSFGSPPPVTLTLDAFGGHVELSQRGQLGKKGPFNVEVTARDVDVAQIPGIRETLNLPVTGTLRLDVDIAAPTGRLAVAKGAISFTCASCVVGDGKTPLKVAGNPFLGGGLTLPKVRVGDLHGEVAIDNGVAKLKNVESKSPDLELALEGELQLRDPFQNSLLNAYLRFKMTDAFLRTAGTVQTLLQMAGASGRRPDGAYGLRLTGRVVAPSTVLSPTSQLGGAMPTSTYPTATPPPRPGIPPAYAPPAGAPPPAPPPPPPQAIDTPPPPPPAPEPPPAAPTPPPAPYAPPTPPEPMRGAPPPAPAAVADPPSAPGPDSNPSPPEENQ